MQPRDLGALMPADLSRPKIKSNQNWTFTSSTSFTRLRAQSLKDSYMEDSRQQPADAGHLLMINI